MSRYISFRDFDWLLLTFVLIICGLGLLDSRRRGWHVSGQPGELPEASGPGALALHRGHRLPDERDAFWPEISGGSTLGQTAGGCPFSAIRVGEADLDPGGSQVLRRPAPARAFLARFHEGGRHCAGPHAYGLAARSEEHT